MSVGVVTSRRVQAPSPDVPRLMAGAHGDGRSVSLAEHLRQYGELGLRQTKGPSAELVALVEASGLQGRGGAAFPAGRKLRTVAEARGRALVLVNGVEGEPMSGKDKVLMRYVPHLVLDGAAIAAVAVGARAVVIVVGSDGAGASAAMRAAIAERTRGRHDRVSFRLVSVPVRFVAGEETALVNWLNGGPVKPLFTPPRPFERGVHGSPTLVQNVETLANVALIARFGSDWFRALGTADEPGSALVTFAGAIAQPGIYEIPLGLPLAELITRAGGLTRQVSAFLVGGYFGAWVSAEDATTIRLLDSQLRPLGATLGGRVIFALPQSTCGIVETARLSRYLADESAGQCGPCVRGLDAVASSLQALAWGKRDTRLDDKRLDRWLLQIEGRGACRHPDGAARLIASGLRVFSAERDRHRAGTCTGTGKPLLPVSESRKAARQ